MHDRIVLVMSFFFITGQSAIITSAGNMSKQHILSAEHSIANLLWQSFPNLSLRGFRDQNPKSRWEAQGDLHLHVYRERMHRSRILVYAGTKDICNTGADTTRSDQKGQVQAIEILHILLPMDTLKLYLYWHRDSITVTEGDMDIMFFLLWMCNIIN